MKTNAAKQTVRGKFTLIELLVVIAIITILASMLLPALNKARARAKASECVSRQKQVVQAQTLYTGDSGGWLFVQQTSSPGSWGWFYNKHGYIKNKNLLRCPDTPALAIANNWHLETYGMRGANGAYYWGNSAYETWPNGSYRPNAGFANALIRVDRIIQSSNKYKSLSAFYYIADSIESATVQKQFYAWYTGTVYPSTQGYIHLRHSQKTNLGYLDGHVDSKSRAEMAEAGHYPGFCLGGYQ